MIWIRHHGIHRFSDTCERRDDETIAFAIYNHTITAAISDHTIGLFLDFQFLENTVDDNLDTVDRMIRGFSYRVLCKFVDVV